MRIAVITDAHGNLPALEAALAAIRDDGVAAIYHTGDAIGIGPFPAEVLDRLLHTPDVRPVMGNHDALFVHGLPGPRPAQMSAGEVAHQRWVHDQLDPAWRAAVAAWPWSIAESLRGVSLLFMHYALDASGQDFLAPIERADGAAMDRLFASPEAQFVFYGHQHYPRAVAPEIVGRARYVNPGALGCGPEPLARYALLEVARGGESRLTFRAAPYDPAPLFRAFVERDVPERAVIAQIFFS